MQVTSTPPPPPPQPTLTPTITTTSEQTGLMIGFTGTDRVNDWFHWDKQG